MQTFLPYPDFAKSAEVLDPRRLGKQRVEVLQVMRAITVPGYGWRHHPTAKMWKGYEEALAAYGVAVCREWCRRGHTAPAPQLAIERAADALAVEVDVAGDLRAGVRDLVLREPAGRELVVARVVADHRGEVGGGAGGGAGDQHGGHEQRGGREQER